jgi:four helix bundle protein
MTFQFEKLPVYQKAVDFADQVCATTEEFSRGYGFLVDQLNRAALSISANIAEGNGRFTKADRKNLNRMLAHQRLMNLIALLNPVAPSFLLDNPESPA